MENVPAINQAILGIMSDIGAIGKNRTNEQQRYKYRGVEDVLAALQPLCIKHKVFPLVRVLKSIREERPTQKGGVLAFTTVKMEIDFVSGIDGSKATTSVIGEGMDSGDKSTNKAMSVGFKYGMFFTFCIPTQELMDSETESPEPEVRQTWFTDEKPKKANTPKPITQKQRGKLFADMKDAGLSNSECKLVYDWHLDRSRQIGLQMVGDMPPSTWASEFIDNLDDIIREYNEATT